MNKRMIVLVSCMMAFLGSLLPWMTAQTMFGEMSVAGTDGDGVLTIILAVVGGVLMYRTSKKHVVAGVIVCGLGLVVSIFNMVQVNSKVQDAPDGIIASIGVGLYLCLIGFAMSTIIGLGMQRDKVNV